MKRIFLTIFICCLAVLSGAAFDLVGQRVLFSNDSTDVPKWQEAQVELIADYIKAHPEELFFLGGFTSVNTPEERVETVCELRAMAVKDMLVKKFGVNADKVFAIGVGVSRKAEENDFNEKVELFKK